MLAHRLRHRIDIQQVAEEQDPETGAVGNVWVSLYTNVPAEVLTGVGKEFVQSASLQAQYSARINLRWFPGLHTKMRIVWDGNTYDIVSIETDATARQEYRLKVISTGPIEAPAEIDLTWDTTGIYYYQ